ncbi:T9SS type B sorting domain-containing protein [Leptobacterium sp. I13]|uniref:T9SS type B sorting domain-containing protein n=1 Tax=Leptobacterium meishanense TaxID=3128904 RepID=UPI0030EB826F
MIKTYQYPKHPIRLLACIFFASYVASYSQVANPFDIRYQNNVKGEITFISNNILNRLSGPGDNDPNQAPNDPYNLTGNASWYNDWFNMRYIDVDTDASTFSSSSATLSIPDPNCSRIVYAGLYWSAVYRYNEGFSTFPGNGDGIRENDFNQVKLRVPGGVYQDITADEIIFDGLGDPDFGVNSPYTCYADVTSILTALPNPDGEYFVGNIRATNGYINGGGSAGWTIVIVYENPTLPGKFITTFDGFAGVDSGTGVVDVDYTGFNTLPAPLPVRANLSILTLEGDNRITGDQLAIRANSNPSFTQLSNTVNPATNFFNANITIDDAIVTTRNPNSINTLGHDADRFAISNPLNSVIPNDETAATLRISSTGDRYYVYFNALDVEIIEPLINLSKTVEDGAGNDIGGGGVSLGQEIVYVLNFQNVGNDDATNYTIRDVFPPNVVFPPNGTIQAGDVIFPAPLSATEEVTYVFDPVTNEITFSIPDGYIEIGDPEYEIRIKVRVVDSCSELRDACSNIIQNQAFSTYQGVLNDNVITDDPSFSGFDNCNFGIPGATNFLTDLDNCDFTRDEVLCGNSITITAGAGFDTYVWTDSAGNVVGNTQSITVSATGTYTVTKTAPAPCLSFDETVNVVLFGNTATNPVIPFADEVATCPNDGDDLPKIFLCGLNDSRFIDTEITDSNNIVWQRLDESSCPAVGIDDCANKNQTCTWIDVKTGNDFNVNQEGEYRLVINYQNGCFNRFYFNVSQNLLSPSVLAEDIICNTPGEIIVTNVPSDYEYSLDPAGPYQTNPVFSINTAGTYTVYIRQQNLGAGSCLFSVPNIDIRERDFSVDLITEDVYCGGTLGSIRVQVNDVNPQYYYEISQGGTVIDNFGPSNDNDYTFSSLNPGTYTVTVNTDDGCVFTGNTTIRDFSDLALTATVSQNVSCREGNIQMNASGGQTPYNYAIYSYNGVLVDPADYQFQTSVIFDVLLGEQGTYEFIVVDRNNCTAVSNPVTIIVEPDAEYTSTITDISCFGANDGSIIYTLINDNGFNVTFSIDGGPFLSSGNFTGLAPGDHEVIVRLVKGNRTCDFPETHTITEPPQITGNAALTQDYTCISNGVIEVQNASGGVPPYEYSLNGGAFQASAIFNGLTDGNYNNITIRDANGCTTIVAPVVIDPLNPITDITFNTSAISCGADTSTVTLTPVGGTAPFIYEITAPAGSIINNGSNNTFTNLDAGTYTFFVTDNEGCTYQENLTIDPLVPLGIIASKVNDETCLGSADGALTFTVSNFNGSYTYSVNGGAPITTTNATVTLTGLAPGNYTIVVNDPAGPFCTATSSTITINAPPSDLSLVASISPITCTTQGSITANASGGWGGYEYQLTGPVTVPYQNNNTFSGLTAGNYTVSVRDSQGCEEFVNAVLVAATPPDLAIAANDLCYDPTVGLTITATITSGGQAPFQYNINGGAFQNSNTFTGLTPGTYTISVVDQLNCTDSETLIINPALTAVAVLTKDLDCSPIPDASISINVTDGYPPYIYEVSNDGGVNYAFIAGSPYTTNAAGDYQFRVTDSQGCVVETNVITVTPALNPLAPTIVTQNPLCNGDTNGSIVVTLDTSQGVPPFEVSIDGGATFFNQTSFFGLGAGNYDVVVRDSKLCLSPVTNVALTAPPALTATETITPITCDPVLGNVLGGIDVTLMGLGTPNYTYSLLDSGNNVLQTFGATNAISHSFTGLDFGNYYIVITDANSCEYRSGPHQVASPPDDLDIDTTIPVVNCVTGATINIEVIGGVGPFGIRIYNSGAPFGALNGLPVSSGIPERNHQINGLVPGVSYVFEVIDTSTNCTYIEQADPVPNPFAVTVNADDIQNVSCFGNADGGVTFTATGYTGTSLEYQIFEQLTNNPVTVPVNVGPVAVGGPYTDTINNLPPGDYYVLVTETDPVPASNQCSASASFRIEGPAAPLAIIATSTPANCLDVGQINATASGGWGNYEFELRQGAAIITPYNPSGVFTNLATGNYDVFVQDDEGCEVSTPVFVDVDTPPTITSIDVSDQCTSTTGIFTIDINTTNGLAPLSYSIDGVTFVSSSSFVLATGSYTVTVRDANGCTDTEAVDIFPALDLSVAITAQPSCLNNDGSITATGSGGSGNLANYQYELLDALNNVLQTNNTGVFNGLQGGINYSVRFLDLTVGIPPCTIQEAISLEVATPVTLLPTDFTHITCNGANDGTITVNLQPAPANDNPPYSYTVDNGIDPPITQSTNIFTGLNPGNYTITVTSNRGCVDADNVILNEPLPLAATAIVTAEFACNPDNTTNAATITATATLGTGTSTGSYSFSIDGINFFSNGDENYTFDVATPGAYTITVRDDNACETTVPVNVNPLVTFTIDGITQATPITCANPETVQVAISGGSGDFTYELLPSGPVQVNNNSFNLPVPDTYTFQVTDNVTGCFSTISYTVLPFDFLDINAATVANITCFGDIDGIVDLTVTGYTGTYDYEVRDLTNALVAGGNDTAPGTIQITNLPSGTFTVTVTETQTPFCQEVTNVITVNSPSAPLAMVSDITNDLSCADNDGQITVTASGGWGSYEYELTGPVTIPYQANNVFSGLTAGNYTISVRDANGCIVNDVETLVLPTLIVASAVQEDGILCAGNATASIRVTATGGAPGIDLTANYQYILNFLDNAGNIIASSTAQNTDLFTDLPAGNYSVTVLDALNCGMTTTPVTIGEPTEVLASLALQTSPTCLIGAEVQLSAAGGTGPYSYSLDGTTFSGNFASSITLPVAVGNYQYYVRDTNGCVSSLSNQVSIDIIPPLAIVPETTVDINCNGEATGLIQVAASGGLGSYLFTLLADDQVTEVRPPQTDDIFSGLFAGDYYVRVESNDCVELSERITIAQGVPLTAREPVVVNPLCSDDTGRISIQLDGGTGVYQFAISPNLNEFQQENTFDNLTPGMYTIVAQDSNGCRPFTFQREIVAPQQLSGSVVNIQPEFCAGDNDGFVEVGITGGAPPYATRLVSNNPNLPDTGFVQGQTLFTNLAGGFTYVVLVQDANGCESQIVAELDAGVAINANPVVESICTTNVPTNNITVTVDPSVENDVMYALDSNDDNDLQLSNTFNDIAPGTHFVRVVHTNSCEQTVTFTIEAIEPLGLTAVQGTINEIVATAFGGVGGYEYYFNDYYNGNDNSYFISETGDYDVRVVDANGCVALATIFMEFIDIEFPDFFTPDGDGNNDFWQPRNTEGFPNVISKIYDRYGRLVAELRQDEAWLGTYNGTPLPTGDYWYVVKLYGENDDREFVGHFTLYR